MAATISRSRRILSGHGEDEAINKARTVMTAFDRLWNTALRHPGHHPQRKQLVQTFLEQVQAYTTEAGELRLNVGPSTLSLDGQSILRVNRRQDNYIHQLFQAGVRQLAFHPDLTDDELNRFIAVLQTDFTDPRFLEDDVITLLWDQGLHGISYSVFDLIDEPSDEDDPDSEAPSPPEAAAGPDIQDAQNAIRPPGPSRVRTDGDPGLDVDDVMSQAMAALPMGPLRLDPEPPPATPLSIPAGDRLFPELAGKVAGTAPASSDWDFAFSADQAKAIRQQLRASDDVAATKFGAIVHTTLEALDDPHRDRFLDDLGMWMRTSLQLASEDLLAQALHTLADLADDSSGFMRLAGHLQTADVLDVLASRLQQEPLSDGMQTLLQVMADTCFPMLWQLLLDLDNSDARQTLLGLLTPGVDRHLPFLLDQIANGSEAAALQALTVLKPVPLKAIVKGLVAGLRHPSAHVRLAVAMRLRRVNHASIRQVLLKRVHDADEQVRQSVIQMLLEMGEPGLEEALLAALRRPGFSSRSPEEKRRLISSLARVATAEGLAVLRQIALEPPASVKDDPEAQIAAIRALASRADRQALPGLKKLARQWFADKEVKRTARFAVTVITRQADSP